MKRIIAIFGALVLFAVPAMAGEWHAGTNNLCTDCHTMHFSMQHEFDSAGAVASTGAADGNWLGSTGPNNYLLKDSGNALCTACHDGQTFAPDVVGANTNAAPSAGRMAGALNDQVLGAPYDEWKGHTLDLTTLSPPGYKPANVDATSDPWGASGDMECLDCHLNHGIDTAYRNLGPRSWGATTTPRPTYVISTTNTATADVWIDLASYTAGTGSAATFNPYYDFANIEYNRNDAVLASGYQTSNTMDVFCASCHGEFHGGQTDADTGGEVATGGWDQFNRHPTTANTIGLVGGGHSNLTAFYGNAGNVARVKTYGDDYTTYADATPGCVTCHKAHGNQNPFGLFLLDGAFAGTIDEEGGFTDTEQANGYGVGYAYLCGQCHTQGQNWDE